MIVISDTTAITNLYQIGHLDLLKQLYGAILIPKEVYFELSSFPGQKSMIDTSDWITVSEIKDSSLANSLLPFLDKGEAEAIVLAIEKKADFIIIDEQKGREVAKAYGLSIVGVLGTLVLAKQKGLINFVKPILDELRSEVGFRLSQHLYETVCEQLDELE